MRPNVMPILLMTATITPPADALNLAHADPLKRLHDYEQALIFYMTAVTAGIISHIVFAENSGTDTSSLRELINVRGMQDKVEVIEFFGLDHPGTYGRGYGEFKLLDYAMSHSSLITATAGSADIWKVTGRYRVANLQAILKRCRDGAKMRVHCRNYPMRWADMYFFSFRRDFYEEHVREIYTQFNESHLSAAPETVFREWLDNLSRTNSISRRIRPSPEIEGIRGLDGANYGARSTKRWIRRTTDKLAPWLWI